MLMHSQNIELYLRKLLASVAGTSMTASIVCLALIFENKVPVHSLNKCTMGSSLLPQGLT